MDKIMALMMMSILFNNINFILGFFVVGCIESIKVSQLLISIIELLEYRAQELMDLFSSG